MVIWTDFFTQEMGETEKNFSTRTRHWFFLQISNMGIKLKWKNIYIRIIMLLKAPPPPNTDDKNSVWQTKVKLKKCIFPTYLSNLNAIKTWFFLCVHVKKRFPSAKFDQLRFLSQSTYVLYSLSNTQKKRMSKMERMAQRKQHYQGMEKPQCIHEKKNW